MFKNSTADECTLADVESIMLCTIHQLTLSSIDGLIRMKQIYTHNKVAYSNYFFFVQLV